METEDIFWSLWFLANHAKVLGELKKVEWNNQSVGKVFDEIALRNPEKVAFLFENQKWTFKDVFERSNQIGNFFSSFGIKKGDVVSLFMEDRPEYIVTWLGLSKIGAVTALINYNLCSIPLKHCVQLANSKAIICGNEVLSAINDAYPNGSTPSPVFIDHGSKSSDGSHVSPNSSFINLDKELLRVSATVPKEIDKASFTDGLFLMYTSGTTGLPKSAMVKHARFILCGKINGIIGVRDDDVVYTTMPFYHTTGGIFGVSIPLIRGVTFAFRNKFSASNFWKDCIRYEATATQYMGETCRYLLRQPPSPEDNLHKVRLMFGIGLRAEIWEEFQKRFGIKDIIEIYGSTEGNCFTANYFGGVGACGYIPRFLSKVYYIQIAKLDEDGNPKRNEKTGLVEQCKPGEPGELISKIIGNHPLRDFKGYVGNKKENEKKILRDVRKKGDTAFRTGDLFVQDEYGFLYFKDRMGESYRWKGENVSSTEVEYVISNATPNKYDVVVFGVKVPHTDGQCGMAVVADENNSLDLNVLAQEMKKCLPSYAIPLFLRRVKTIEQTGTHKMKKSDFQKEGYDITKIPSEEIFFLHGGSYTKLTEDLFNQILTGKVKL